jgi:beta-galactosidase
MRTWGKGIVWVNGHCLGRFWNIGPTQTMYVPGPWLKAGTNEFIVLDLLGPRKAQITGLKEPILNELHPELDFANPKRPAVKLALASAKPVLEGTFPNGADPQEVKLPAPASGRYFCLESVDAQDGKHFAAIAELDLIGADGKPLLHTGWTVAYVDSEERLREDGIAENAIDGQSANYWHTQWGDAAPDHPHRLILDLGQSQTITAFRYTPRQGNATVDGRIKDYKVYIGDALVQKN